MSTDEKLKEYDVHIHGHPTTLQLNDSDAVLYGVKGAPPKQGKKPVEEETQAKPPAKF
jgi:hypothetical protein